MSDTWAPGDRFQLAALGDRYDGVTGKIRGLFTDGHVGGQQFAHVTHDDGKITAWPTARLEKPADAPQDHGPLAAHLSDRTLAKVLSRPAHVPSLVVLDAAEHLAAVATTVLATMGAEAKHAPLSALGQALADYRAAVQS